MLAIGFALILTRKASTPTESTVPTSAPPTTAVPTPTTPPTTDPPVGVVVDDPGGETQGVVPSIWEVAGDVWENVGENGYQTGFALISATIALIIMKSLQVKNYILIPVAIGAFWAGWLAWNTIAVENNVLFPGDVSPTKIWDVARTDQWGFLVAVIVGCVAAVPLWRNKQSNAVRLVLLVGTIFGSSLGYTVYESISVTTG